LNQANEQPKLKHLLDLEEEAKSRQLQYMAVDGHLQEMSMNLKQILDLSKNSVTAWVDDYAPSMGAAIAYYTLFSITPLLIIAIAVAGLVFGHEAARGEIIGQIQDLIGQEGAIAVQSLLKNANEPAHSMLAIAGSVLTMIIGATTVFGEIQSDLDRIWRVSIPAEESGLWRMLRTRLLSFGLVLGVGFLLLISLIISAAIAGFGKWLNSLFAGWEVILLALDLSISFAITTLLFALIYKFQPRATIAWRDVWIGAAVTAFLFAIGKFLIGLYLGKASVASGFGAAGSLVILLLWVYFGAQIFLLGAEFTRVYSNTYGSKAAQGTETQPDGARQFNRHD
jgi:membrane protein